MGKHSALFRLDHGYEGALPLRMNAALLLRREYSERINQGRREEILKAMSALLFFKHIIYDYRLSEH